APPRASTARDTPPPFGVPGSVPGWGRQGIRGGHASVTGTPRGRERRRGRLLDRAPIRPNPAAASANASRSPRNRAAARARHGPPTDVPLWPGQRRPPDGRGRPTSTAGPTCAASEPAEPQPRRPAPTRARRHHLPRRRQRPHLPPPAPDPPAPP